MLDRLEADRGKRTGVSARSQGLDQNTLHSNQAATSVNQMMTAAEQQIDLIARMFAETGVKRLFQLLHDHAIKYQDQKEVFELRGKYVEVNPSNWRQRNSLSVTVGIGNMNKDQQLLHLTRMFEMAQTIVAGGGMGILISEQNIYNYLRKWLRMLATKMCPDTGLTQAPLRLNKQPKRKLKQNRSQHPRTFVLKLIRFVLNLMLKRSKQRLK